MKIKRRHMFDNGHVLLRAYAMAIYELVSLNHVRLSLMAVFLLCCRRPVAGAGRQGSGSGTGAWRAQD